MTASAEGLGWRLRQKGEQAIENAVDVLVHLVVVNTKNPVPKTLQLRGAFSIRSHLCFGVVGSPIHFYNELRVFASRSRRKNSVGLNPEEVADGFRRPMEFSVERSITGAWMRGRSEH